MTITTTDTPAPQRLSFSTVEPKLQLAWDSTSSSALKRCPRYYQLSIVEGYAGRGESAHLRFGIEYGNALTTYAQERAKGSDYETAVLASVRYALEHTWDYELGRPWTSDEPTKTRETLIRSIIWYLDKFSDDSMETLMLSNGKPAVEMSFKIDIDAVSEITGESYVLCGYLDREVEFADSLWITDHKTTKSALDEKYFAQYTPNNQVSQYSFAGKIMSHKPLQGVIIEAAQVGVTFTRFQRSQILRTDAQLEEWLKDSLHFIRQNEAYVAADYWPMNDTACHQYNGCAFRVVCSASPGIRQKHLDALFTKRIWDPLVIREI